MNEEFIVSLVVLGGIIMAGTAIVVCITIAGIAIYNRKTKDKVTKELYEQKERKNGKHGGSRGTW